MKSEDGELLKFVIMARTKGLNTRQHRVSSVNGHAIIGGRGSIGMTATVVAGAGEAKATGKMPKREGDGREGNKGGEREELHTDVVRLEVGDDSECAHFISQPQSACEGKYDM